MSSPRRKLKKQLAEAKQYLKDLPMLIDLSNVYGDSSFESSDIEIAKRRVERLEEQLAQLPKPQ